MLKGSLKFCFVFLLLAALLGCDTFLGSDSSSGGSSSGGGPGGTNPVTTSGNRYPIILVHGFAGWDRHEKQLPTGESYYYWGGTVYDIQEELRSAGYDVRTAAVGPFSSNWERACDLYAYIKGGTVDYGQAHADRWGVARFGRTYEGIYPEWGGIDPSTGEPRKVHLIGHSMGGQTIRTLVQLLEEGHQDEQDASGKDVAPLFEGGNSWVHSVTSISTPHDGTSAADAEGFEFFVDLMRGMIIDTAIGHASREGAPLWQDYKLDHWGLHQGEGESTEEYLERIADHEIWESRNFALWDLSPQGAKELNQWVKAQENVYYFSWTTNKTRPMVSADDVDETWGARMRRLLDLGTVTGGTVERAIDSFIGYDSGYHVPCDVNGRRPMTTMLQPVAVLMGRYENPGLGIDQQWWPSDGLVNDISQNGPKLGSEDRIVHDYDGRIESDGSYPERGIWYHWPVKKGVDHMEVAGNQTFSRNRHRRFYPTPFFLDMAKHLWDLPRNPSETSQRELTLEISWEGELPEEGPHLPLTFVNLATGEVHTPSPEGEPPRLWDIAFGATLVEGDPRGRTYRIAPQVYTNSGETAERLESSSSEGGSARVHLVTHNRESPVRSLGQVTPFHRSEAREIFERTDWYDGTSPAGPKHFDKLLRIDYTSNTRPSSSNSVERIMNVMNYVGYRTIDAGIYGRGTWVGTRPPMQTYDHPAFYTLSDSRDPESDFEPTRNVYLVRHGDARGYSAVQITELEVTGANAITLTLQFRLLDQSEPE
ncbi:esterase/lipase family protein [Alkalispirochaeta sphaeroplastigenens]|uniref:esterase/lipase family protein n=1 Tax=Alkalispirochaeta sphaeroplastigenens TaxID=1187066 RepID=UPI0011AF3581|nr:hypothetical protein [Alkalispirochaeta sphaeroplastigenens]